MTNEQYEAILKRLDAMTAALNRTFPQQPAGGASAGGAVASDEDLDGKYGNEPIRKDPSAKYWDGASYVGERPSDCPADYLLALAKYKDACAYMNEKSGDEATAKYITYDRRDAACYRGWAKRNASKLAPAKAVEAQRDESNFGGDNEEIPF